MRWLDVTILLGYLAAVVSVAMSSRRKPSGQGQDAVLDEYLLAGRRMH